MPGPPQVHAGKKLNDGLPVMPDKLQVATHRALVRRHWKVRKSRQGWRCWAPSKARDPSGLLTLFGWGTSRALPSLVVTSAAFVLPVREACEVAFL